jgi:Protein of unknown function (DUF1997)
MQLLARISFLIFAATRTFAKKIVSFRASASITRPLLESCPKFVEWFGKKDIPLRLLKLNPGFDSVESLDESSFRGYIAPLKFPGLTIQSVVDFDVSVNRNAVEMICREDSISMKYEGSQVLARLVSSLIPIVVSNNIISIDEDKQELKNSAQLTISFGLPQWFPLASEKIEEAGSQIIAKNIQTDLDALLDNILSEFRSSTVES